MRALTSYALAAAVICCAALEPSIPAAQPRAGDPTLEGADYLLSEPDFREALSVVRERLSAVAPGCRVGEMFVVTATRVEAWYYKDYGPSDRDWRGMIAVEKKKGRWKVAGGKSHRPER